jgi:signal transduction histidine kinase
MSDTYHVPALILTGLLLPAFGYLYFRFRDTRTCLWLYGFCCAVAAMVLIYTPGTRGLSGVVHPWFAAAGQSLLLVGSAMFLASLSPLSFSVGRFRILYVVPYTVPLVLYALILYGFDGARPPAGAGFWILPGLGALSFLAGVAWSAAKLTMPRRVSLTICLAASAGVCWGLFQLGAAWALTLIVSANFLMTGLLVIFVFRRFSPGVVLSVVGFTCWSLAAVRDLPAVAADRTSYLHLIQAIAMGKAVAAIGMILLALEDQVAANQAAEERERRARRELESYTRLMLARRRVEDFDRQGNEICETLTANSRFAQAALLLHSSGRYRLAGTAGFDPATVKALEELAARIPPTGFLAPGSAASAVDDSQTVILDLEPWLWPGDDLQRLGLTTVLAVPMVNRSVTEGALLLSARRPLADIPAGTDPNALRPDDLLPIEMLAGRLLATRSQTMMFEKLMDSEKFGHLGQLAANVSQQLNNPLTVILGYASLLEGTSELDRQDRKAVESILTEARRMRTTLDSLSRIARPQSDEFAAVSVAELLTDLSELHRPDFLQRSIEFRLSLAANLPRVMCSAQQLRQAVRHCLRFAIEAVESSEGAADEPRVVRLEAASEGNLVQIMVAHSGPGFLSPERAFDPFMPPQPGKDTAGLGLSLCATIMRDNNGRASAVNTGPRGAAIILELKAA